MLSKKCSRCKRIKSIQSFNLDKTNLDGHNYICRSCQKELRRIWYLSNLTKAKKMSLSWSKKHPIKARNLTRKWRKNNPFAIYWISFKNRAKRYNINFNITKDIFIQWYNNQKKECIYCGLTTNQLNKSKDKIINGYNNLSIDRKNNKIGYKLNNIVLACMRCNNIKSDFFTFKEMIKLGKFIRRKALKLLK
jgi:5-methylcytosine-specific restriction endonuclease McrA